MSAEGLRSPVGQASLDAFFAPRGIAVVGASNQPNKAGCQILCNLRNAGYRGQLAPVNPREREVGGLPAYPSLDQVPAPVELVVMAAPAAATGELLEQLRRRRQRVDDVRALVVVAAGFAETGTDEGRALQQQLVEGCRALGIRVLGPNCVGVIDNRTGVDTTFICGTRRQPGGVSFVSQSGAFGAWILSSWSSRPAPVGLSKFVSVGNGADVTLTEMLEYLEADPHTRVVGMYLEGTADARRLIRAAASVARRKPLVVLKVGKASEAAEAAYSHTGSLAGQDALYHAAFRQFGMIRVEDADDLSDALLALERLPLPTGNRVFVLTQAGGPGVHCLDALREAATRSHAEVALARVADATRRRLAEALPPFATVCRPEGYADITAAATVEQHALAARWLLEDPNVDVLLLVTVPTLYIDTARLAQALRAAWEEASAATGVRKPMLPVLLAGEVVWEARRALESWGLPTFETPARAARAAVRLIQAAKRRQVSAPGEAATAAPLPGPRRAPPEVSDDPLEWFGLAQHFGLRVPTTIPASSADEAARIAGQLGLPLVVKALDPRLPHKTEAGAVAICHRVTADGRAEADLALVRRTWEEVFARSRAALGGESPRRVVLQQMVQAPIELVIGALWDQSFGPVIMVGGGGVTVELYADVTFGLLPLTPRQRLRMLEEVRVHRLLSGFRGTPPGDLDAVLAAMESVERLALSLQGAEVEINPLMVGPVGEGCWAVDVRIRQGSRVGSRPV